MDVDSYRAYRQFERFLRYKTNSLIGKNGLLERIYERGIEGELIGTIFYDNKSSTVEIERTHQSSEW